MPGWGSGEGAVFASKCILKVEYAKGAYIPGLEITRFAPGIPRFLVKNGLRVQQFTLKVIVVTYKTFKLIVGFFETLSKNAQKPRKIKEKEPIQPLLEGNSS